MADRQRGGVNKADAATVAQLGMQIDHRRHEQGGHQLHEARIAQQRRELTAQVALHVFGVIGFEGAIVGLLEPDHYGHHLDFDASGLLASAGLRPASCLANWGQTAAKNRPRNKTVRVYSSQNLLGIDTTFLLCSIFPGWLSYPELALFYPPPLGARLF
jgi:hypothetical protein